MMSRAAHVYVVDDEETIRVLLDSELTERGYTVTAFPTGDEVLGALQHDCPDLVILDIKLIGSVDGLQVLAESKEHHPQLPVILCTAYGHYRQDPAAWPADGYFLKSDGLSDLLTMVDDLIQV